MKEKTTKIRGFQTPRLMKYFLPPTHIIFYLLFKVYGTGYCLYIHESVSKLYCNYVFICVPTHICVFHSYILFTSLSV